MKRNRPEDFWDKVEKAGPAECWNYLGSKSARYGVFNMGGIKIKAHRMSYELSYGKLDSSDLVCHHCDNTRCVNPLHLFKGSQLDNMRDVINKGRKANAKGVHNGNCKYSDKLVSEIRRKYSSGNYTQRQLAKIYGVGKSQIHNIVSGAQRVANEQTINKLLGE